MLGPKLVLAIILSIQVNCDIGNSTNDVGPGSSLPLEARGVHGDKKWMLIPIFFILKILHFRLFSIYFNRLACSSAPPIFLHTPMC